jgi:2-keto-4-pentenoate hydratase/2-oxohepta-3-ene-1,7-dioic acid hydratase in catechol pathway
MKLGRFRSPGDGAVFFGRVKGDRVRMIESYRNPHEYVEYALDSLEVLPPTVPTKIVGIGLNYRVHAEEMKMNLPAAPADPVLFLKPPSSVLAPRGYIAIPPESSRVDYEAELGVVIGSECRNVAEKDADGFVLGYTAFNDVTARDIQNRDGQWCRAKGFDTFAPFGPTIETEMPDPQNARIRALRNGTLVQDSRTSDMIFSVRFLVAWVSRIMTLYPGDIIATGTPPGIGRLQRGDEIVVEIEGLDPLVNYVK